MEGLIYRTSQFDFADSQFDLGFFLDGEELRQEVDELLGSLAINTLVDDVECFFGGFEGEESLNGGMITLS